MHRERHPQELPLPWPSYRAFRLVDLQLQLGRSVPSGCRG
jgi:hypothetical protein